MTTTIPHTDHFQLPFPPSSFGSRFGVVDQYHPTPHRGTDFIAAQGSPIRAVATGKVVGIYPLKSSTVLGNVTVVATKLYRKIHGEAATLYVGYCHQQMFGSTLHLNSIVTRNTVIGYVGQTGSAAKGAHLHLTFSYESGGVFAGAVFDPIHLIEAHDGN